MTALLDDVREFLDDLVSDLTDMHVKAAQYSLEPHDPARVEALAKLPAGLIDRAQALSAQLAQQAEPGDAPKAKAKPASKR